MKADAISAACASLVDVVGSLTIEVDGGDGVSAAVTRAACNTLAHVRSQILQLERELGPSLEPIDPELNVVLTTVIGRLTIALGENVGIDPTLVTECCENVSSAHSMIRALECSIAAARRATGDVLARQPSAAPLEPNRVATGPLLLVEDNVLVRRGLTRLLRKDRDVVDVTSAERAHKALRSRSDWSGFLCDIVLGEGPPSGLDVLIDAHALYPLVPAALMTGFELEAEALQLASLQGADVLLKPVGDALLRAFLRRCDLAEPFRAAAIAKRSPPGVVRALARAKSPSGAIPASARKPPSR